MKNDKTQDGHVFKNPEKVLELIHQMDNMVEQPTYDLTHKQDIPINFRVDEKISPAMFKADPLIPGGYVANSLTLRAMRPNIFVLGDSTDDLESVINCQCCKQSVDRQFWKMCPYCGQAFAN